MIRIIYLSISAILCLSGIIGTYDGTLGMLMRFTYLSNTVVLLMMVWQILLTIVNVSGKKQREFKIPAVVKDMVIMCSSNTFLTFGYLLYLLDCIPGGKRARK